MFANHIEVGQLIQIKTKGGDPPYKAPSLVFTGEFVEETGLNYKEGYIHLSYTGEVSIQNEDGKIIDFKKGLKIQSVPRSIIETVDVYRKKKIVS